MRRWHSVNPKPAPGTEVRIKGWEHTGDETLGDQPFQATAKWDGHLWLSTNTGYFPPERFEVTGWQEEQPGEETLDWHVGGSGAGDNRLDTAPRKAFFYWKRGRQIIREASYFGPELAAEIERRVAQGEEVPEEFRDALEHLRKPRVAVSARSSS